MPSFTTRPPLLRYSRFIRTWFLNPPAASQTAQNPRTRDPLSFENSCIELLSIANFLLLSSGSEGVARYFFDFTDGAYATQDRDGHECASDDEARMEILKALPEVLLSDPRDADEREVACSVRDEDGAVLYRTSVTLRTQRMTNQ